jgi:EAL domain-containing protein (putative c-di-GMP-specific phosphodiesterase class I)
MDDTRTVSQRSKAVRQRITGHVLVVDDEKALLKAYTRWLESAGHTVEIASDGEEAAQLAASKNFDAVVSDIGLPGLDGIRLLKILRERDLDVPVVLVTGSPETKSAIEAIEYGALRYLVKPLDEATLCDVVATALRLHLVAKLKRQALENSGDDDRLHGDLASLSAALDRGLETLWMAYQPIVDWSNKSIHAFEALVRSNEATLPSPGGLFSAAQRLGRSLELGRAIRERVARDVDAAPAEYVFVNLHPSELDDDWLYSSESALARVADHVVLEITERTALDRVPDVVRKIEFLRGMGFRIAIDDLGAGYAGLSSFAALSPDVVKYDMSLVRGIHRNRNTRRLVTAMTELFGDLGLTVVAEGVETAAERDALVRAGCTHLQGYLFAKPGPAFPAVTW